MAKRLDAKALKGAFARGKTKRNLDFLVPSKEQGSAPVAEETTEETDALTRSGPQRRKRATAKRNATKRSAAKRKTTQKAKPAAKRKTTPKAKPKAKAKAKAKPKPKPKAKPKRTVEATAAPSPRATRVVHHAAPPPSVELVRAEAELELTVLYDGWAPAAAPARPGALRRLRARIRCACEELVGVAVRVVLG